jgi:hypothetical protein
MATLVLYGAVLIIMVIGMFLSTYLARPLLMHLPGRVAKFREGDGACKPVLFIVSVA